jgi:hypothetical protein
LNSLKTKPLVDEDTPLTNFRSVFSMAKQIEQKIIWTGNISELAHFIKTCTTQKRKYKTPNKNNGK